MNKYVILLRGINVGGKNTVSMKELKELLEKSGFHDVTTYINSGNIIFSSGIADIMLLKSTCEDLVLEKFNLKLSVMILSADDLIEALDHAPDWWNDDIESKHNAIFVIPPASILDIFQEVGEGKPEYERVGYFGQVIFWSAPLKTFSMTRWSKVVGSSAYSSITIRNANTAIKLAELCKRS